MRAATERRPRRPACPSVRPAPRVCRPAVRAARHSHANPLRDEPEHRVRRTRRAPVRNVAGVVATVASGEGLIADALSNDRAGVRTFRVRVVTIVARVVTTPPEIVTTRATIVTSPIPIVTTPRSVVTLRHRLVTTHPPTWTVHLRVATTPARESRFHGRAALAPGQVWASRRGQSFPPPLVAFSSQNHRPTPARRYLWGS